MIAQLVHPPEYIDVGIVLFLAIFVHIVWFEFWEGLLQNKVMTWEDLSV